MDEGVLEVHVEHHEEMTASQSMDLLRLQRARNRIWLDLRDGIDLKPLPV